MEKSNSPIAIIIADTHLSENTVEQNHSVFSQAFKLCAEMGVRIIFHLGDIFNSRKGQPEIVLNTFKEILDSAAEKEISIIAIPGNHDKSSYVSESSYLDAFNGHPAFTVVTAGSLYNIGSVNVFFCPYYDEKLLYPQKLKEVMDYVEVNKGATNILLTHCSIDGVTNNSGLVVKNEVPHKAFEAFNAVFVGHYHNRQAFSNIVYIGSSDPRNFGEDEHKGCVVLNDDGSYEFVNFAFKPFITIDMVSSDLTLEVISKVKDKTQEANIRFRVQGEVEEINKPLVAQLNEIGVKVEVHKEIIVSTDKIKASEEIILSSSDILDTFDLWVKERKVVDSEFGRKLLMKRL